MYVFYVYKINFQKHIFQFVFFVHIFLFNIIIIYYNLFINSL